MASIESKPIRIVYVTIICAKRFDELVFALAATLPLLDPDLLQQMKAGRGDVAHVWAQDSPLYLFVERQHGALLAAAGGAAKAVQYEIGNPITAASMTRSRLAAGLYAPLRVILYEGTDGRTRFEYDRPSSLFSHFEDPGVTEVGLDLDAKLESLLLHAAG